MTNARQHEILSKLRDAFSVTIDDEWTGLGSPYRIHYELKRDSEGLSGTAEFMGVLYPGPATVADIAIPEGTVLNFLSMLAGSHLSRVFREQRFIMTDNYPYLSIEVHLQGERVRFHSRSQGNTHVPWSIDIAGSTLAINSSEPARALALLRPYLKKDILQTVLDQP